MTDIKDVFDTINTRMKNPFFGSFILSWLILNWQIPLGLVSLNDKELLALNYNNYIEFVTGNLEIWHTVYWPLIWGFSGAIFTPFILSFYKMLRLLADQLFTKFEKRDPDKRFVRMEKYLSLRQSYVTQQDFLASVIEEEKSFQNERNNYEKTIANLNSNIKSKSDTLDLRDDEISRLKNEVETISRRESWLNLDDKLPEWIRGEFLFYITQDNRTDSHELTGSFENDGWYVDLGNERISIGSLHYAKNYTDKKRCVIIFWNFQKAVNSGFFGKLYILVAEVNSKGVPYGEIYSENASFKVKFNHLK